jgi:hypothetical protein
LRQTSLAGNPASASFRISTIWLSVNRDRFMRTSRPNPARKFYFPPVSPKGKFTAEPLAKWCVSHSLTEHPRQAQTYIVRDNFRLDSLARSNDFQFLDFVYRNTADAPLTDVSDDLRSFFGCGSTGEIIALLRITMSSNPLLLNRAFLSHWC